METGQFLPLSYTPATAISHFRDPQVFLFLKMHDSIGAEKKTHPRKSPCDVTDYMLFQLKAKKSNDLSLIMFCYYKHDSRNIGS